MPPFCSAISWTDWGKTTWLQEVTSAFKYLRLFSFLPPRKYSTITALEQRQQYKDDFCAEYDEYRALHDRIGAITEMFVQLGSKINTLSPGTQEYKVLPGPGASNCSTSHESLINRSDTWHPNTFSSLIFSAYGGPNTTKVPKV